MEYYLYHEITDETPREIAALLNEKLTLRINSGGGNVFAGITLYNLLKNKDVEIIIDGFCASAASLLCAAGNVTAAANSLFMIHNPAIILYDFYTAEELEKLKNSLDLIKNSIVEIYSSKMNIPKDRIAAMMDAETWLSANEALGIGLIDKIEGEAAEMVEKEIMNRFKNSVLVEERARVSALNALKNDSPAVNSVINKAIEQGDSLEKVKPYIDAIKSAGAWNLKFLNQLKADNENSGAGGITAQAKITDAQKSKLQAANIAKIANEMLGVGK